MNKSNVLNIKSTLLLQSIIRLSLTLISIGIAVFISIIVPDDIARLIAGIIFSIGAVTFLVLYTIKESREENNTASMMSWTQKNYDIRINRRQAMELVRYGNAELENSNHMIQLSLVERNGNFSLHKTQEIKKEME